MPKKIDNVVSTRLAPAAKDALVADAKELKISASRLARIIITKHLRKTWEIEDPTIY